MSKDNKDTKSTKNLQKNVKQDNKERDLKKVLPVEVLIL